MMGAVYDDKMHVLQACTLLNTTQHYRPLIYWLVCHTGESMAATRAMSLLCLVGTALALLRCFRRPEAKKPYWRGIWVFVHPIYLFPFFYASQISTSITMLWAAVSYFLLSAKMRWYLRTIASVAWIGVGLSIRIESLYYWVLLLGAAYVFDGWVNRQWNPVKVFGVRRLAWFGGYAVGFVVYDCLFKLVTHWQGLPPAAIQVWSASMYGSTVEMNYPRSSFFAVQIYAVLLYLKNLLYPIGFSFYGPWTHWWRIHSELGLRITLYVVLLVLLAGTGSVLCFSRSRTRRYLSGGLLVFLGVCGVCSFVQRIDWYFASREVWATGLCLPFVAAAIDGMSRSKIRNRVASWLAIYLAASVLFFVLVKYRSYDSFMADEVAKVGRYSPHVNFELMNEAEKKNDWDQALASAYRTYRIIPLAATSVCRSAATYWVNALSQGYRLSMIVGDKRSAQSAAKTLLASDSYISTSICLTSGYFQKDRCLEGNRKANFCEFVAEVRRGAIMNPPPEDPTWKNCD